MPTAFLRSPVWDPSAVPLDMRTRLYHHLVWTTRGRAPMIDAPRARFLSRFLPLIAVEERGIVLALGMVTTHVHLLIRLVPATQISRMVQRMKGGSSHLANKEGIGVSPLPLLWEEGYDLESVSPRAIHDVVRYVLGQGDRHPNEAIAGWSAKSAMELDFIPRAPGTKVPSRLEDGP